MTKSNWQQKIDEELGKPKWNKNLSRAIQEKAYELEDNAPKTNVFIPFISVAMLAILVFLSVSILPSMQQGDQAALQDTKFQKVYYSKLLAGEGIMTAQDNLAVIGMKHTNEPELLQQLSSAYEQKQPIDKLPIDVSEGMSVILYDEFHIAYEYNIYSTATDEILFEDPHSLQYYKYDAGETSAILNLLEQQLNLKVIFIMMGIIVIYEMCMPRIVRKYYNVRKRKETFDHITLERMTRWAPLPYLFYFYFKMSIRPITLTWWDILVPFIVYQSLVLVLMKQQKEPKPYIVERMLSYSGALIFLIILMLML